MMNKASTGQCNNAILGNIKQSQLDDETKQNKISRTQINKQTNNLTEQTQHPFPTSFECTHIQQYGSVDCTRCVVFVLFYSADMTEIGCCCCWK